MKIKGFEIKGANIETIVIPRGRGCIVFKAQAVLDMDEFKKLCPVPEPPTKLMRGGARIPDIEDFTFKHEIDQYGERKVAYIVIKSLEATEDLVWDTVKIADPTSWLNYKEELKTAGFSDTERTLIINGVFTANALNQEKIKEAQERFLSGELLTVQQLFCQTEEVAIMQSGGLANGSESNLQESKQTVGTS